MRAIGAQGIRKCNFKNTSRRLFILRVKNNARRGADNMQRRIRNKTDENDCDSNYLKSRFPKQ